MKNIHKINQQIYITSDEEIKEGNYAYYMAGFMVQKVQLGINVSTLKAHKKVILTTDQDLIKDGIQAIDDEFLEWFVKNPNCEEVEVEKDKFFESVNYHFYKIIIPKKEPKITNCGNNNCQSGVINGVNPKICRKCNPKEEIKQERSYSDMQEYATFCRICYILYRV